MTTVFSTVYWFSGNEGTALFTLALAFLLGLIGLLADID